jgi:protein TonB
MRDYTPKLQQTALRLATPYDKKQRHKMVLALALILMAIGIFIARDWRNLFGSSDASVADWDSSDSDRTSGPSSHTRKPPMPAIVPQKNKGPVAAAPHATEPPAPPAVVSRTTLPPLEVEVVAGDSHRIVRAGDNAVRVELTNPDRLTAPGEAQPQGSTTVQPAANAGAQVRMSADTSHALVHPVQPSYPMLARQMKVQGAVVLQALIGSEGTIQDLKVLSGPAILASAAEEAVRQWRFKPYLQNGIPLETEAKITVNFTISTL